MMNANWLHWLATHGAILGDGQVLHFGKPGEEPAATIEGSIITDLSHYGLLEAAGPDAAQFLQNQTGNDVRKIDSQYSQLNSYCSPRGRMYAVFRLFRVGDSFLLRMPAELIPAVHKRLQMFVLMSKVKLSPAGDSWLRIGIAGPLATEVLQGELGTPPQTVNTVATHEGLIVIRVPGTQRYEIYGQPETLEALWRRMSARLTPVGRDAWPLLDILNGIPTVYNLTSEHFVPQMANLQLIDALNFKKGCYPGQEVVARMQYLGKLKRRMYRFEFEARAAPEPGTEIIALIEGTSHETGEIVDARTLGGNRYTALAVLQSNNLVQALRLGDAAGPELALKPLPYAVTEETGA
ncbi:MAG TPA: folate-binding protein [Gammaproteobacteria bacterium]|nr:folate-binding protein [Gammaproteobacteria bacterium]